MSEPTRLKVHYGIGTVREGPYGVDLSAFRQVTLVHPDGENARIGDVVYWLTGSFSLDPEVWSVTVQGLWSRSATEIQWELRSLMRTVSWKGFLEGCRRRGYECVLLVQPCPKEDVAGPSDGFRRVGGSSSDAERVVADVAEAEEDEVADVADAEKESVTHVADAGEHVDSIVRQMEIDDLTARAEDEALEEDGDDSSEEDEGPIPQEWKRVDVEGLAVHDEHESPWEYHGTEVRLRAMFADKGSMLDAIKLWALSMQWKFRVLKSSQEQYTVVCEQAGDRKSTRLNSSHRCTSRMPSSA